LLLKFNNFPWEASLRARLSLFSKVGGDFDDYIR
jgi:hypothetical protein